MSPRPVELPKLEFHAALELARAGRASEAALLVERELERRDDTAACAPAAANALAEIARQAEAGRDLATATRALERAVELCPRYADLHHRLAAVLIARGRRLEARQALDQALSLNPRFLAARLERSMLDAREGLLGEAIESLRALSQELPVDDPRAFQQGLKSLERAEWDAADALLRRALRLSDPDLKQRLEQFRGLLEGGEPERAVALLAEVLPRHQGYPDLHYLLGLAHLKLGEFDDALAALARALELNPDFHEARVQLAHGLECVGQTAQAAAQLALVLEREPGNRHALELRGAWAERGRPDHAAPVGPGRGAPPAAESA